MQPCCLSIYFSAVESRRVTGRHRWYMLLRSYGDETTLHGIRYIVEPSNLMCRRYCRMLWILVNVINNAYRVMSIEYSYQTYGQQKMFVPSSAFANTIVGSVLLVSNSITPELLVQRACVAGISDQGAKVAKNIWINYPCRPSAGL